MSELVDEADSRSQGHLASTRLKPRWATGTRSASTGIAPSQSRRYFGGGYSLPRAYRDVRPAKAPLNLPSHQVETSGQKFFLKVQGAFSNFMRLKEALAELKPGKKVIFQLNNAFLLDHTVMEYLHDFQHNYEAQGGKCEFIGHEYHDAFSEHPLAARRMNPNTACKFIRSRPPPRTAF